MKLQQTEINEKTDLFVDSQLQQNFGAFLKLLCEISLNDLFIVLSNGLCKQDSENFTKLQRHEISF